VLAAPRFSLGCVTSASLSPGLVIDLITSMDSVLRVLVDPYHHLHLESVATVSISNSTMSEKNALRLEEGIRSPAEPPTSRSPHQARRRARQYKAACFYFSLVMANNMHKYAIANTPKAQQTRWNELIAPVNAHLSPWILLFSVREIHIVGFTK
jgi:hypothetical protein